jgi:[acyl-carrier-protein] S-malonyltransferase
MTDTKVIYIFPGQGSQYRGIGSDLYERFESARRTYQEASDILGYDIARLSFEDPADQINLTRYTQPVLLTHHMACLRAYDELSGHPLTPDAAAGHSLGEYSALVVAGALSFSCALKLVSKRGELMGDHGEGEMSALPVDLETATHWADKYFCAIAGINLATQTVVAGAAGDLDTLESDFVAGNPRKRPVRLKTEGAFHTYYMVEAARRFRRALDAAEMAGPGIKVLSNYAGRYHQPEPQGIKAHLFFQLFHPVNWVGCLQSALADGMNTFIEFGGGIGKGEHPAEKRPNLESIIKKATRGSEQNIRYFPAINVDSIEATARQSDPA